MQFYQERVIRTLNRLEVAFNEIIKENDPGRITMERDNDRLVVSVKRIGDYTFSSDDGTQTFSLQSPESGIHMYKYDEVQGFWKSMQ